MLEDGFKSSFDNDQKVAWRAMFACFQEIMTSQDPTEGTINHMVDKKGTPPATPRDEDPDASHCLDDSMAPVQLGLDEAPGVRNGKDRKEVKDRYMDVFRKEVDFHHKIAYRFEKAYRLNKQNNKVDDEELDDLDEDPEKRRNRLKMR